jgi:hypothetical protein
VTCDELADLLPDYVAGTLTVAVLDVFRLHLCECCGCVVLVEQYTFTIKVSRALPKAEPLPAALEARLRAAVAAG